MPSTDENLSSLTGPRGGTIIVTVHVTDLCLFSVKQAICALNSCWDLEPTVLGSWDLNARIYLPPPEPHPWIPSGRTGSSGSGVGDGHCNIREADSSSFNSTIKRGKRKGGSKNVRGRDEEEGDVNVDQEEGQQGEWRGKGIRPQQVGWRGLMLGLWCHATRVSFVVHVLQPNPNPNSNRAKLT